MGSKACTVCRVEKPATAEFFQAGASTCDGLRHQCKACRALKSRARYEAVKGGKVRERHDWRVTGLKHCPKCKTLKPADAKNFYISSRRGFSDWCKPCESEKNKAKRITPQKFESETHKQCTRCREIKDRSDYYRSSASKDGLTVYCRPCYKQLLDTSRAVHSKKWQASFQAKKKACPALTMHYRTLGLVRKALGRKGLKQRDFSVARSYWTAVGYDRNELVRHIERQFLPGMSWENAGEWHIDHITPASEFKYSKPDDPDFKVCWGLANLRPLWAEDNIKKNAKREFLL